MKKRGKLEKKRNKEKGRIYSNFVFSLKYIKDIKNYIIFSVISFFIISLFGFLFPIFFRNEIITYLQKLMQETIGLNVFELISFIISNNIQSAFMGMILGVFLGVGPLLIMIVNAYVLGFVANGVVGSVGAIVLWRLFPHGIFEIPAILISISLGLKIGISLIYNCLTFYNKKKSNIYLYSTIFFSIVLFFIAFPIIMVLTLLNKKIRTKFYKNIRDSFIAFIFLIVPLLVVAGIIEGLLIYLIG